MYYESIGQRLKQPYEDRPQAEAVVPHGEGAPRSNPATLTALSVPPYQPDLFNIDKKGLLGDPPMSKWCNLIYLELPHESSGSADLVLMKAASEYQAPVIIVGSQSARYAKDVTSVGLFFGWTTSSITVYHDLPGEIFAFRSRLPNQARGELKGMRLEGSITILSPKPLAAHPPYVSFKKVTWRPSLLLYLCNLMRTSIRAQQPDRLFCLGEQRTVDNKMAIWAKCIIYLTAFQLRLWTSKVSTATVLTLICMTPMLRKQPGLLHGILLHHFM